MSATRIIPAGPMRHADILPMIRTLHDLLGRAGAKEAAAERGDAGGVDEYHAAAELEERIRQPITVAGRVLAPVDGDMHHWQCSDVALFAVCGGWYVHVNLDGDIGVRVVGRGPTIAAALADARERYLCAIDATLLRMGGLLREVTL